VKARALAACGCLLLVAGAASAAPSAWWPAETASSAGGKPAKAASGPATSATLATPSRAVEAAPPEGIAREDVDAGIARAVELRVGKHFDEALAELDALRSRVARLPASDPAAADARAEVSYQRGLVLEEAGRLADAANAYEDVAAGQPYAGVTGHARLSLASVQLRLGKTDAAAETYRSVLRESPKLASAALLGLAGLEETRGRVIEAARAYRDIIRNFPAAPEKLSAKNALESICGRLLEAKGSATEMDMIVARGDCLMDANRAPEAEALYSAALKRRRMPVEDRVVLLYALGGSLDAQDRTTASERAYRQIVKLAPRTPEAAFAQMAIVQGFLDRGRLSDAVRELERIVKGYPGTPAQVQAQFEAGSVYEAMRDLKRAEDAYRKVLELAPQSPWGIEAQQCLVRLVERKP